MKTVYPPIGIAHIINDITDLFSDRLIEAKQVRVACVFQPKSLPHIGTAVTIFSAFAIAQKISKYFSVPTSVLLDSLDNSPSEEIIYDGTTYSRCLSFSYVNERPKSELFLDPILNIAALGRKMVDIPYYVRRYNEIQKHPAFRHGLSRIIRENIAFQPILSPNGKRLRIRPVCQKCGLVDKEGKLTEIFDDGEQITIKSRCPEHGVFLSTLNDPENVIDLNTPIRTVLRSVAFHHDAKTKHIHTIVVNGGDWAGAWMQRVYFDALAKFNCTGSEVPFNIFTPQILDETGAKLSKTIYMQSNDYKHIGEEWLTITAYEKKFGDHGMKQLFNEISLWADSPDKFFRDYTINFLSEKLISDIAGMSC